MLTRLYSLFPLCMILLLAGCASANSFSTQYAAGYAVSPPVSCVPYARQVSNINIHGDAWTWWGQARQRGTQPRNGAVLVLAKTQKLKHGHVAVVKQIINDRQINVTHSNWGSNRKSRSIIYEKMRVEDISPANDWSLVRFWNYKAGAFGHPYPAYGFIYQ